MERPRDKLIPVIAYIFVCLEVNKKIYTKKKSQRINYFLHIFVIFWHNILYENDYKLFSWIISSPMPTAVEQRVDYVALHCLGWGLLSHI